jgi:hypothetical protein
LWQGGCTYVNKKNNKCKGFVHPIRSLLSTWAVSLAQLIIRSCDAARFGRRYEVGTRLREEVFHLTVSELEFVLRSK